MQPTTSSFLTPLALKTAGAVLIVSSLIDLVFMLWFPPELGADPDHKKWFLYATSQLVDRGLLPLVGIAFAIAGDWIEIVSTENGGNRGNGWRIGTYSLASLLGLIFVLIIPFQLITTNALKSDDLQKIGAEVTRLEQGIKGNLAQIRSQSKDKIKEQIAAVDKEIKNGAQGQGLQNLQITKSKLELLLNDPKKFEQESEQNIKQLKEQQAKAEAQAGEKMLKTGVRTGLASLLLALGYVTIGWTGLRGVMK
jgi:ABC-type multidrug transport system fused ATPase/permease subunit